MGFAPLNPTYGVGRGAACCALTTTPELDDEFMGHNTRAGKASITRDQEVRIAPIVPRWAHSAAGPGFVSFVSFVPSWFSPVGWVSLRSTQPTTLVSGPEKNMHHSIE